MTGNWYRDFTIPDQKHYEEIGKSLNTNFFVTIYSALNRVQIKSWKSRNKCSAILLCNLYY